MSRAAAPGTRVSFGVSHRIVSGKAHTANPPPNPQVTTEKLWLVGSAAGAPWILQLGFLNALPMLVERRIEHTYLGLTDVILSLPFFAHQNRITSAYFTLAISSQRASYLASGRVGSAAAPSPTCRLLGPGCYPAITAVGSFGRVFFPVFYSNGPSLDPSAPISLDKKKFSSAPLKPQHPPPPPLRALATPCPAAAGLHTGPCPALARASLEYLKTNGGHPLPPNSLAPSPDQSDHRGKKRTYRWENVFGPFLVHKLLGPRPPLPRSKDALPPPHQPTPPYPPHAHPHAPFQGLGNTNTSLLEIFLFHAGSNFFSGSKLVLLVIYYTALGGEVLFLLWSLIAGVSYIAAPVMYNPKPNLKALVEGFKEFTRWLRARDEIFDALVRPPSWTPCNPPTTTITWSAPLHHPPPVARPSPPELLLITRHHWGTGGGGGGGGSHTTHQPPTGPPPRLKVWAKSPRRGLLDQVQAWALYTPPCWGHSRAYPKIWYQTSNPLYNHHFRTENDP